ncbi:MAG: GNAT family N-acetyltransferase [Candidatus Thermoplasmatota archaeon]|jgi:ribosomal protein S18 acetylase RimI-like enzyme|nr:GNAT family N-acetyltransferase [Candidatus Thermoplasmatota archaeon]
MDRSIVRKATAEDWGSISRISSIAMYDDYINKIGPSYLKAGDTYVLEKGNLLGFLKIQYMPDGSLYLSGLRVDPAARRKGVGEALTRYATSLGSDSGKNGARVLIQPENNASLSLSRKLGFSPIEFFHFFQGEIDLSGFSESKNWPMRIIDLGFEYSLPAGNFPAMLMKKGAMQVSVSRVGTPWNNRAFTVLGNGQIPFRTGKSVISVPQDYFSGTPPDLEPLAGFGSAVLLEKKF